MNVSMDVPMNVSSRLVKRNGLTSAGRAMRYAVCSLYSPTSFRILYDRSDRSGGLGRHTAASASPPETCVKSATLRLLLWNVFTAERSPHACAHLVQICTLS